MAEYEYGRIKVLARELAAAGVAPDSIATIMQGGEDIKKSTKPEAKAAWMSQAMTRMDSLLDYDTRRTVREACACCLGGKRLELVRAIDKQGGSLEERVTAADAAKLVFGHSVALHEDGRVFVRFGPEGPAQFRCPCQPKATAPLPLTYCMCCGGHVKHHLQIALGRELQCEVLSSNLSTGGKETCVFAFTIGG